MKQLLFIILFSSLLFSFSGNAQTVTITGRIVEQATQAPLDYANITVIDATSQEMVTGTTSDHSGSFSLTIATGHYDIKIGYLAFNTYLLENKEFLADFDMQTISLEPNIAQLKGVEVIAERTTVEYHLDKRIFNVGKDLISKGGSVTDILDNVPSVSVGPEGEISLRGSGNVTILINGKPSVLTSNNGLEQFPAEMVEKVEIVTNPSARYEASGSAGIINIILKKNKYDGFGGSLQLTTGVPAHHRANVNVNYKTEQFNIFTNIGYRYSNYLGERSRYQSVEREGITTILDQTEDQKRNDDHYNIYLGGDYYINDLNTLTASFYHNKVVNTDITDFNYTYYNDNNEVDSVITSIENYVEPQNYNQLDITHVKEFKKKGKKWTSSIEYDFWNDDENEQLTEQYLMPLRAKTNIKTRDIESSKDLLIQSDFVSPLAKNARLEAGFRGEIRRITSEYTVSLDGEIIDDFDNLLNYDERIYGAYIQYGNKVNKFSYLLGLRTEYSHIGISDREHKFNDDKKYTNLFPTAHLTYSVSEIFDVQLSYSRRIRRPRFWQLNPFGGYSDSRNLFTGNPDLNPMYTDSYEFGFLKRWEKLTLNPSVYYRHSVDYFQFITTVKEGGGFLRMPVNLDEENSLGVEVSATYSPTKWLRLSPEFNYFQYTQTGTFEGVKHDTDDDTWSARINAHIKLPKGLTMQGSFRYSHSNQDGLTFSKAHHALDFSASKDLFSDKASLSFNFRNILDSRVHREITVGENYRLESSGKRIGRRISATFTYRFNRKQNERDRMPG